MSNATADIDTIGSPSGWRAYCRCIGLGGTLAAAHARLCVTIGGKSAAAARKLTERSLIRGDIDEESYSARIDAIDYIADMYDRGVQTRMVATPENDWRELPGGGHQRRMHIHGYH